ncbi:MAG: hypothetical protein Q8O61_08700 [Nocardioides sp.]|nr:hypothetical protein [Nocardioides sp.]
MSAMLVDRGGVVRQIDTHFECWQVELDRLELDVILAERAMATGKELRTEPWVAPCLPGPVPEDLRERAVEILGRQQALVTGLTERTVATYRQQDFADHVGRVSARDRSRPVYVDIST